MQHKDNKPLIAVAPAGFGDVATPIPAMAVSATTLRLTSLFAIAVFINYVDRGNLATAAPLIRDELHFNGVQMGLLLSAFYWTYTPSQLLVGWAAERFGVRWLLAAGVGLWSLATAFTGLAWSFTAIFTLRLLLGLGESVIFPCSSKVLSQTSALKERGRANAAIAIGLSLGPAVGTFTGGLLMAEYGWRMVFVVFGLVSLLWIWPWLTTAPIQSSGSDATANKNSPSVLDILSERSAWGAALGHFCCNYALYFVISWLPLYLVNERGYSISSMAQLAGAIYVLQACGATLSGWGVDRWIASGATANRAYKSAFAVSGLGAAVCFVGCAAGTPDVATACILIAGLLLGISAPAIFSVAQTLAGPLASGRWVGLQNFVGNLAGILAPIITGFILERTQLFDGAFIVAGIVLVVGVFSWCVVVRRIAPVEWKIRS
ncbi:MAG TPA: MFS transporter [Steroidobacteraceae bacterium]|jgi:MFS family permease